MREKVNLRKFVCGRPFTLSHKTPTKFWNGRGDWNSRNGDWNALISDGEEIKIARGALMGRATTTRGLGTQWRGMEAGNILVSNEGNISERREENVSGRSVARDPQAGGSF